MKLIPIYFVFLILLLFSSNCAPRKTIVADLTKVSSRDLLQRNSEWQKSIHTLQGSARITLDTPQYSANFSADVAFSGNDSVLISVTGPLGMRVGKVFIARNRFIFYNQVMNQFYTGTRNDFRGRNFLQFPLEIDELRKILLAQNQFDVLIIEQFEIRDQMYYLTASNGKVKYHMWFDPQFELIKRIDYFHGQDLLYSKEYDQFILINDIPFPKVINFIRPDGEEKQGVSIYFRELAINEVIPAELFQIKVSDSAQQIDLSLENNQ